MKKLVVMLLTAAMLMSCLSGCVFGASRPLAVPTVEETVLYDENGVVITAVGLEESTWGWDLNIHIENHSAKNIRLCGEAFTVNGVSICGYLSQDVAAGKKADTYMTIYEDDLSLAKIDTIATVSGYDVLIIDSDSYNYVDESSPTTLDRFSFTLKTSAADTHVQKTDESGEVIYQNRGITVLLQDYTDNLLFCSVRLLIKNDSDTTMVVNVENASVNDYMTQVWSEMTACAHSLCYLELDIDPSNLKNSADGEPDKIAFTLSFAAPESYEPLFKTPELEIIADD